MNPLKILLPNFIFLFVIIISINTAKAQELTTDDYKNLIDRYIEYWNTGNLENIEEVLHPDFELRITPTYEPETGIETFKESVKNYRTTYPDFTVEVIELIFEGSTAAARWRITATHSGPGWIPPTNKNVDVLGMSFFHFKDGKLLDEWVASNNSYWLQQLGYTIQPPAEE